MILFNDVVEILNLADLNIRVMVGLVTGDRRRVGTALVDRDLLRESETDRGPPISGRDRGILDHDSAFPFAAS